jgi:hypothetical protein
MKKAFLLLLFICHIPFVLGGQLLSQAQFKKLSFEDKKLIVNLFQQTASLIEQAHRDQGDFKIIPKKKVFFSPLHQILIPKAYADNHEVCLYGGWISEMKTFPGENESKCTHPLNSANYSKDYKSSLLTPKASTKDVCESTKRITCNPKLFGTPIICVAGNTSPDNSTLACYYRFQQSSDQAKRLEQIIKHFESSEGQKDFDEYMNIIGNVCGCGKSDNLTLNGKPFSKRYAQYMHSEKNGPHRTCLGLLLQAKKFLQKMDDEKLACKPNGDLLLSIKSLTGFMDKFNDEMTKIGIKNYELFKSTNKTSLDSLYQNKFNDFKKSQCPLEPPAKTEPEVIPPTEEPAKPAEGPVKATIKISLGENKDGSQTVTSEISPEEFKNFPIQWLREGKTDILSTEKTFSIPQEEKAFSIKADLLDEKDKKVIISSEYLAIPAKTPSTPTSALKLELTLGTLTETKQAVSAKVTPKDPVDYSIQWWREKAKTETEKKEVKVEVSPDTDPDEEKKVEEEPKEEPKADKTLLTKGETIEVDLEDLSYSLSADLIDKDGKTVETKSVTIPAKKVVDPTVDPTTPQNNNGTGPGPLPPQPMMPDYIFKSQGI